MRGRIVATVIALGAAASANGGQAPDVWGKDRGCLKVTATRRTPMAQRARGVEPVDASIPFRLRFRFCTTGSHSYAALLFVGLHRKDADFKTDGAGVVIHRHTAEKGLRAYAFVADSEGGLHTDTQRQIPFEYGTVYDVECAYMPAERTLRATFTDALSGQPVDTSEVIVPEGATWRADTLALWNYADAYPTVVATSRLTVLVDNLTLNDMPPMGFGQDLSALPIDSGSDAFSWHRVPLPPLFSALEGPVDLRPGRDATYRASLRPGTTGAVRFALCRFTGDVLLEQEAAVEDDAAQTTFPTGALDPLARGEAVVTATLAGTPGRAAQAVVLRGRLFHNPKVEPADLRPGDEIVVSDVGAFLPATAVSATSRKGVWWRRPYRVTDNAETRTMLCVAEHDPSAPESCLAPPLRLPLSLTGWYDIWVKTVRPEKGGGVDVRLSDEPYFLHLDPQQVDTAKPSAPGPRLVDVRFRSADLSGRDLVFQQPQGTYDSETKLCNAAIAGVRFVRLSAEQVARTRAELADRADHVVGFDNDGYSYFWRWATHDKDCIARLLEPLRTPSASFLNFSLGGLGGLSIPTPYTELFQLQWHVRDGDFRANTFLRWCRDEGVNIVDVLAERAHELGLKLFVATMMERSYSPDRFMREHPEWRVKRGRGTWDYAKDGVHAYQVRKIAWICANHDIDGFTVDFTRYGHYFNEDEPDKVEHMNRFVRALRREVDQVNEKKTRRVQLCASFADESKFIRNWGTGKLEDQGLDPATWIREGIFDMLMPEGPTSLDFVKLAAGSRTQVWPRKVSGYALVTDQSVGQLGPTGIERNVKRVFDAGAPGVFFFNHEPWITLGRLGIRDELDLRAASDASYGLREGAVVEFADWLPSWSEREKQRQTFRPLTVPSADGRVDATALLSVRNVFDHAVAARVRWVPGDDAAHVQAVPVAAEQTVGPGGSATFEAGLSGAVTPGRTADSLFADVAYDAGGVTVLRHRVPVRLVPELACGSAPGGAGNVAVGEGVELRAARVGDVLRLTVTLADAVAGEAGPLAHDDFRGLGKRPGVVWRLASTDDEKAFFELITDFAGSRGESRWSYSAFHNSHLRKTDWECEWASSTEEAGGRTAIAVTVPFAALGGTPPAGACWRAAVSVRGATEQTAQWPPGHKNRIECFGRLVFE